MKKKLDLRKLKIAIIKNEHQIKGGGETDESCDPCGGWTTLAKSYPPYFCMHTLANC